MDLRLIKKMCEKREGGLKKLASDINMSEANLHRCITNNKIQATDLENIARLLNIKVGTFFGEDYDAKDSETEIQSLKKEIERLKSFNNAPNGDRLYELWSLFMANQAQYHKIMEEMASIYGSSLNK